MKPKREGLIKVEDTWLVEDADVIKAFGSKCAICKQAAIGVLCGKSERHIEVDRYADPDMRNAADRIRSELGTNFEVPLCRAHATSGLDQ